jgi:hypothetical protein
MFRVSADVDGVRIGGRYAQVEQLVQELAAADGSEPVAFLVAEYRDGHWLFGEDWAVRFSTCERAQEYAATVRTPYQVGVLAIVPVDGGRLYPDPDGRN